MRSPDELKSWKNSTEKRHLSVRDSVTEIETAGETLEKMWKILQTTTDAALYFSILKGSQNLGLKGHFSFCRGLSAVFKFRPLADDSDPAQGPSLEFHRNNRQQFIPATSYTSISLR